MQVGIVFSKSLAPPILPCAYGAPPASESMPWSRWYTYAMLLYAMHWLFVHAAVIVHWLAAHALDKLLWSAVLLVGRKLWGWFSQFFAFLRELLSLKPFLPVLEEELFRPIKTFVAISVCMAAFAGIVTCICACSRRQTA